MSRKSHQTLSLFNSALAVGALLLLNVSAVMPAQAQKSVPLSAASESIKGKPDPDRIIKRRFPRSHGTQTITGVVRDATDPTGQPIPNASVTLIQSNGGIDCD